jgi:hypothetical protein
MSLPIQFSPLPILGNILGKIADGQYLKAMFLWRQATDMKYGDDEYMVTYFHCPCISAMLNWNQLEYAITIYNTIPKSVIAKDSSGLIKSLEHRLLDLQECVCIGTRLYPYEVSIRDRWKGSFYVFGDYSDQIQEYYPGRVKSITNDDINVVLAGTKHQVLGNQDHFKYDQLVHVQLSHEQWATYTNDLPKEGLFFEALRYSNGQYVINVYNPDDDYDRKHIFTVVDDRCDLQEKMALGII